MHMQRPIIDYCAYCNVAIREGYDVLYDENTENHFCDYGCFRDWADDHFDEVLKYYAKLNIYEYYI